MSRSGYSDDYNPLYRGTVASAARGKRGQALLRDLVAALNAMPDKRLSAGVLKDEDGCMCSLGALAEFRRIHVEDIAFDDDYGFSSAASWELSNRLDAAQCLINEVMFMNDEGGWGTETPETRWHRMWVWAQQLIKEPK